MSDIKPRIVAAIEAAGYTFEQQVSRQKWCGTRNDNVWFDQASVIRADKGTKGAEICRRIAGAPNGKATASQDHRFDTWFTDGYRGKGGTAI